MEGRFDYSILNIQDDHGKWLCPSCGFDGTFRGESFSVKGPQAGTGICFCCMYEPGFDDLMENPDNPLIALQDYSRVWQDRGFCWRGRPEEIPSNWDGKKQFEHLKQFGPPELFNGI